jgi:hypothetical protein
MRGFLTQDSREKAGFADALRKLAELAAEV